MTWIEDSRYTRPPDMQGERHAAGAWWYVSSGGHLLVALVREIDSGGVLLEGYVLPKGGVHEGESREQAARREIQEEAALAQAERLGEFITLELLDSWLGAQIAGNPGAAMCFQETLDAQVDAGKVTFQGACP